MHGVHTDAVPVAHEPPHQRRVVDVDADVEEERVQAMPRQHVEQNRTRYIVGPVVKAQDDLALVQEIAVQRHDGGGES